MIGNAAESNFRRLLEISKQIKRNAIMKVPENTPGLIVL